MSDELLAALATIEAKRPRVLVWGDGGRDEYEWTESTSDPIRHMFKSADYFAGMASGVVQMARTLDADVLNMVQGCTVHRRVFVDGELRHWVTYPNENPVGDTGEVLRYMRGTKPQAILVSDYGRGACTPAGLRQVIDAANKAGVPVLVDPHRAVDWNRYEGATLVKCNQFEANAAARANTTFPDTMVITHGDEGIALAHGGRITRFPADPVDNVLDTTGAGDCVLAVLGCCVAAGVDLPTACRLANAVAGLKCQRFGPLAMGAAELRSAIAGESIPVAI